MKIETQSGGVSMHEGVADETTQSPFEAIAETDDDSTRRLLAPLRAPSKSLAQIQREEDIAQVRQKFALWRRKRTVKLLGAFQATIKCPYEKAAWRYFLIEHGLMEGKLARNRPIHYQSVKERLCIYVRRGLQGSRDRREESVHCRNARGVLSAAA